nr:hypothetical protein [uncultured Flavobacterium sp.]
MTESKIVIRTSKSTGVYNKSNKYEVLLNNELKTELDYKNNRIEYQVKPGGNIIEFKNENTTIIKEVNLKNGQEIIFTINASATYKLILGIMIGIAITGLIIQLMVAKKVILPLIFIPFIPLFLLQKKNFPNSFEITTKN